MYLHLIRQLVPLFSVVIVFFSDNISWGQEKIKSQFAPPKIITIIRPFNHGQDTTTTLTPINYIIDRGINANINIGDTLNVYRKQIVNRNLNLSMRIYIGVMKIIESQDISSIGEFISSENIEIASVQHKTAMKNDLVVPRLALNSSVLFGSGQSTLNPGTASEFDKIAKFVEVFSPTKAAHSP